MMTIAWLLLLVAVSCQNVNSQSTTDDEETCGGGGGLLSKLQRDVDRMLDNQQRLFETIANRLGEFQISTFSYWPSIYA